MCTSSKWKQFCLQWRLWIRPILMSCYGLFVIIVLPVLIVNSVKDGFSRKDQLILIGGLFVLTAIPFSVWHITQHIVHFTKPILQKHIIRILWMVPIYALNAWLGLIFPYHTIYMDSIRECYEAYVIYNFMVYLLNYLNLEMDLEATLELKPPVKHIFPLCCMTPWQMGREFIHNCKHGILQYAVVRPITTFISVVCELCGVYGESTFSGDVAFPYILVVNNLSQFVAMYCLVLFYQANKTELKPMKPVPKFLCIKAVIFFSFFQGVIITFLVYFGYIKNIFGSEEGGDYKILSSKIQNFLICIEMFIAALAHQYSFPHDPFHINIPHYGEDRSCFDAFIAMWDISDVQQDVSEHFGVVGSSLSRRFRGRTNYQMARGGTNYSEADCLIQPTQSGGGGGGGGGGNGGGLIKYTPGQFLSYQSELPGGGNINAYSSMKNRYGAFDGTCSSNSSIQNPNATTSGGGSGNNNRIYTTASSSSTGGAVGGGGNGGGDGINIIKQSKPIKDYSPQYGAPKVGGNYFHTTIGSHSVSSTSMKNDKSNNSDNTTATTTTTSSTRSGETFTGLTGGGDGSRAHHHNQSTMRKSDSTASDWLSTPTEEMMGIDVKGLENDRIVLIQDPNV